MPSYAEIFNGPPRSYRRTSSNSPVTSRKRYITIHNTSNDATAEGEASYAKVRTDGTSSHYYCDHDSIVQSLDTDWCAGHVGSLEGNTYGISYEITGFNGWTRAQWLANVAWDKLTACIARDCKQFGIPVRRLTVAEMKLKTQAGFITHNDARLAWGGTDHTDPGAGFPMDHLLARVSAALNGDDMSWSEVLPLPAPEFPELGGQASEKAGLLLAWTAARGRRLEVQMADLLAKVDELKAPAPAPVDVQALVAALKPELDAAAERAVRKVLGTLDNPTV